MKKDKKFLLDLENELKGISKKKKDAIVLKYRNIIDEELSKKRKISPYKFILKSVYLDFYHVFHHPSEMSW